MDVTLHIESLAHGGRGVARLEDGRTAFVSGAVPGDTVRATITADKKRYALATASEVLEPSVDRVTPPCPYFGVCGGCQWQHVAYQAQLKAKQRIVVDALARVGGLCDAESVVRPVVPSGTPYGYRNKIELAARVETDGLKIGFMQEGTDTMVQIDSCLLLAKRASRAPKALRGALRYLSGKQDLGISRVGIRVAEHTRDLEVSLWTGPTGFPRNMAATTLSDSVKATGVTRVLAKGSGTSARGASSVEILKGKGAWRERLNGRSMLVSSPSFFQVNTRAAEKLVELAIDRLDPSVSDAVLDLYSGVGTFTLPIAEQAGETVAVESSRFAIADLTRNAEQSQVDIDIIGGDAEREIRDIGSFDKVIVDPPRTGLAQEATESLAGIGAARIVYVSCDPATLARDAGRLRILGYTLTEAIPVDLFPQTSHVETIAVLEPIER